MFTISASRHLHKNRACISQEFVSSFCKSVCIGKLHTHSSSKMSFRNYTFSSIVILCNPGTYRQNLGKHGFNNQLSNQLHSREPCSIHRAPKKIRVLGQSCSFPNVRMGSQIQETFLGLDGDIQAFNELSYAFSGH